MRPTTRTLLAAALSPTSRTADLAVLTASPEATTAKAKRDGHHRRPRGAYATLYAGTRPDHNLQLVVNLIDDHVHRTDDTFSFNRPSASARTATGFMIAPTIMDGELKDRPRGRCLARSATTTFNAAYESGLKITTRTKHALYISRYPQGRDATVNYPDVDLKFVNDTGHCHLACGRTSARRPH